MSKFWAACDEPERPPDAWVVWHYAAAMPTGEPCRGCAFKAQIQLRRFPDDPKVGWLVGMIGGAA
jgi:hypothetical protein